MFFVSPFQMVKWSNGKYQVASPNFPEWSAGCPEFDKPSLSVDSNGLSLNFGRQRCEAAVLVVDLFFFVFFFRPPPRKREGLVVGCKKSRVWRINLNDD